MHNLGLHIILDGHESHFDFSTTDMHDIEAFLAEKIIEGNMTILWKLFHDFRNPHWAFTGIFLLWESHFSVHTFPERNYISIDFYVCNHSKDVTREARGIIDDVISYFRIQKPKITEVTR